MEARFYHIDAFTDRAFAGNPAGVCFLEEWLADPLLQSMAAEGNLSETAFLVSAGDHYELRWFTPRVEIDLCGHGTLASAFAVLEHENPEAQRVEFETRSGRLAVEPRGELLLMDFPARPPEPGPPLADLAEIMGTRPAAILRSRDLLLVYEQEDQIRGLTPQMEKLAGLDFFGVIVTAPGKDCDFVSRFFAPRAGIPEDPVTGSAHCTLIPYWSGRLGKRELQARQLSERGGALFGLDRGDRVSIGGRAVTYLQGTIRIGT